MSSGGGASSGEASQQREREATFGETNPDSAITNKDESKQDDTYWYVNECNVGILRGHCVSQGVPNSKLESVTSEKINLDEAYESVHTEPFLFVNKGD